MVIKRQTITLWHKTKKGKYKITVFRNAIVSVLDDSNIGGSDITNKQSVKIRIFTNKDCEIKAGDKVYLSKSNLVSPHHNSYMVKAVGKNFNVSSLLKHYKLLCV